MVSKLPEYVVDLLDDIAESEGFCDYKIETASGSNHGDGYLGVIVSATITGERQINGEQKTDALKLLCKLAPENAARRREFSSAIMFSREVFVYNKLLPLFVEFQREKGLSDDEAFISFPKCYAAVADVEKEHFVLILEDLRERHFVMWPKRNLITKNIAYMVVERLAKYHAISFALKDQRPEVFDSFRDLKDLLTVFFETSNTRKFMDSMYDRAMLVLEDPAHVDITKETKERMLEIFHECLDEGVSEPFSVIGHGDCWINNMLFRFDDGEKEQVSDMCFIDWQVVRVGSPAIDWHHCSIGWATDETFRQSEYQQLMKKYHITLAAQIRRLGSDPDTLFTFENFQSQVQKFGKYAFTFGAGFIQQQLADPKDIPDLDEMSEKMADQKVDLVAGFDEDTQREYNKRLNGLYKHLDACGYWY